MELFRSEEMQLCQLMIPAEAAHDTITALGEVGMLQFKDLNAERTAFQRTYANQIKRCDEMARQLRFFTTEVEKAGILVAPRLSSEQGAMDFDALEHKLAQLESELLELNGNSDRLHRSHNELLELQLVLERAGTFFDDARSSADRAQRESATASYVDSAPLLESAQAFEPKSVQLGFAAGTIPVEKLAAFERLLFRATRGNMFLKHTPVGSVADPASGERVEKSVFVVFFAGERARQKVLKICEAFSANRYPFPEDLTRQRQMNAEVNSRLRELHTTLEAGDRLREGVLQAIALTLDAWSIQVRREKGIYHTLNKLSVDVTRKVLVAEAWVPLAARARVQDALRTAAARASSAVGTVFQPVVTYEPPPTFHQTSKTTAAFQGIVDAYGIARYREANPGVFTIITFPFLFAVMFGDIGHGILMLMFALLLVLREKKLMKHDLGDILGMMFGGRYIILLMSIFSIFTGLIYNEMFSVVTTWFGNTRFACATDASLTDPVQIMMDRDSCPSAFITGLEMTTRGQPFAFGVDPAWHGTRTELSYLNSLKMKMSILLGVAQMNAGIILSYFNQRYYSDMLSTVCEFIPQMIFLNGLFGYLCILIVMKWATGSTADLYHTLIYMFLNPGDVDCGGKCPENKMFAGQAGLQVFLLIICFISVPCMLLPKPLILKKRHEKRSQASASYGLLSPDDNAFRFQRFTDEESVSGGELGTAGHTRAPAHGANGGGGGGGDHGHGDGEFDFGEVMVHQMIHTIEFVLGAVSNTASYLRLWALSLAHSQLSSVFYDRLLMGSIRGGGSPIAIFVAFFVFTCATLGVLMVMESLSAFLHAMRLHWVEFQNKFYHGDGYQFTPFSFETIDKEPL
ncbi:V-type proton ATPase subunit a3-like isoform A [Micractinium conductrix]|uniref:V-type proton ATPase subunit a n=1 Tax=Micractinium conductrix TaxID=554055 RepID=A0A2P6VPY2_9CHLO|nr:V-type proton ATPase subunit a3-like isoform A [Micractinium conductrix]|eukprot:PSC76142.1 V-type proton ATPase subunit a3-like isoform A [Micractinium conductrix]